MLEITDAYLWKSHKIVYLSVEIICVKSKAVSLRAKDHWSRPPEPVMNGRGHWMSGLDPHQLCRRKTGVVGCSLRVGRVEEAAGPTKVTVAVHCKKQPSFKISC